MKLIVFSILIFLFTLNLFQLSTAQNYTNIPDINNKEIKLPEKADNIIRTIFNLKSEDKIDLSLSVILFCILLFLFLIFNRLVKFIPSFTDKTSWMGAIVITLIFSASGGARYSALFLLELGKPIRNLQNGSLINLIAIILAIIIIFYFVSLLINIIKNPIILARERKKGEEIGEEINKQKKKAEIRERIEKIID